MVPSVFKILFALCLATSFSGTLDAQQEWMIPAGGNTYPFSGSSSGEPSRGGLQRNGSLSWSNPDAVFALYFHVDRAASLELAIDARNTDGSSKLQITAFDASKKLEISNKEFQQLAFGSLNVKEVGYVQVQVKGIEKSGKSFGEIKGLVIKSSTPGVKVTSVATNEGNMFYWGRRGPSVHIRYSVPKNTDIEYAYSEITVDKGDDPIGSYFMANGFGEGYFGIQVNSDDERRILFSVWSPFQTDDPKSIPEDQRIELLKKGPEVRSGEFGNEGSGGQSYLVYPWEAGRTYRFLTRVTPDGKGSTIYTSWFGDKERNEWRLIASFRRPKTNTHLTGFHSFLENFNPSTGHITRRGQHGNVWVQDAKGEWHECVSAKFSVDATGGGGHRLDFTGGAMGRMFYLKNCGFFNEPVKPGATFTRDPSGEKSPGIDLESLPGE